MKKGYLYTIIFMAVVSIVFTGLLAGVNAVYKNKIAQNQDAALKTSILASVRIKPIQDVNIVFEKVAEVKKLNDMTYYSIETDSGIVYAVPFEGPGLWGTIKGYIGVSSDFKTILAIAFTEQNETPGLGGRIDEDWYKEQFMNASLETVVAYGDDSGLDAITGATSTSNAVLKIINNFIESTLKELEEANEE